MAINFHQALQSPPVFPFLAISNAVFWWQIIWCFVTGQYALLAKSILFIFGHGLCKGNVLHRTFTGLKTGDHSGQQIRIGQTGAEVRFESASWPIVNRSTRGLSAHTGD